MLKKQTMLMIWKSASEYTRLAVGGNHEHALLFILTIEKDRPSYMYGRQVNSMYSDGSDSLS
jgi:hypothetical protein